MINLEGKVAVVTGASRGIGAATAILLSKAGASIVVNYRQQNDRAAEVAEIIRREGRSVVLQRGNVGDAGEATALIERTLVELGAIDIVVNNAGIWTHGEIGNLNEDVWDETIDINLKGPYFLTQIVARRMKRKALIAMTPLSNDIVLSPAFRRSVRIIKPGRLKARLKTAGER